MTSVQQPAAAPLQEQGGDADGVSTISLLPGTPGAAVDDVETGSAERVGAPSLKSAVDKVEMMHDVVEGFDITETLADRVQAEFDNVTLAGKINNNIVIFIGLGMAAVFWGAFLVQFLRFMVDCNTDNGCKSSAIVPSDESSSLTVCVPTVAPLLTISAGCMSFTVANDYSKIDSCVGDTAFRAEKWGKYWNESSDTTLNEFHKSLAAHQKIWECFKPDTNAKKGDPTFNTVQDPDVACIKQWTANYHAGINDKLYTYRLPATLPAQLPAELSGATAGGLWTTVSDAGHKDLAVKLFSSLFTMTAALKSAQIREAALADEEDRTADMWSESNSGTVVLKVCGCNIASIAGHVGSADPTLNAANNNLQTFRLYSPANYIADAKLWLQNPTTGLPDKSEWNMQGFPSEQYHNDNNAYPQWQGEFWQKRIHPTDDVFTVELLKYFKQATQAEAEQGTQFAIAPAGTTGITYGDCPAGQQCTVSSVGAATQHCNTGTVFGGAPTLFNNGLYFCVTELSDSSKFVEIFAFAEFCLWVAMYAVTAIFLPISILKLCLKK